MDELNFRLRSQDKETDKKLLELKAAKILAVGNDASYDFANFCIDYEMADGNRKRIVLSYDRFTGFYIYSQKDLNPEIEVCENIKIFVEKVSSHFSKEDDATNPFYLATLVNPYEDARKLLYGCEIISNSKIYAIKIRNLEETRKEYPIDSSDEFVFSYLVNKIAEKFEK